jgi:hypothetical protein
MRLGSAAEYVQLDISPRRSKVPPDNDVLVNVAVQCDGFAGNSTQWVLAQAWDVFVTELRELERTRRGQAVLESDFGHAFLLRLFSTDQAGHMAATGMIRYIRTWQDAGALELSFGRIEIDPTMLPDLLRFVEKA